MLTTRRNRNEKKTLSQHRTSAASARIADPTAATRRGAGGRGRCQCWIRAMQLLRTADYWARLSTVRIADAADRDGVE
jgi:hypothetical protein